MKFSLSRFIYLNTYAFLLLFIGLLIVLMPFWLLSKWTLIPQIVIAIVPIFFSIKLFLMWNDKKRQYDTLIKKNSKEFRQESFKIYMKAPCGRKLTHVVLKDLGLEDQYKELLIYKPSFWETVLSICIPESESKYELKGEIVNTYINPNL